MIDGEAVVLGVDGIADALHSRKHDHQVQLYTRQCPAYPANGSVLLKDLVAGLAHPAQPR